MSIKNHRWSDEDESLSVEIHSNEIYLCFKSGGVIDIDEYLSLNKSDAIAIARHFGILNELLEQIHDYQDIVKAVAHIGVDFGYGEYEVEEKHIKSAREYFELFNQPKGL